MLEILTLTLVVLLLLRGVTNKSLNKTTKVLAETCEQNTDRIDTLKECTVDLAQDVKGLSHRVECIEVEIRSRPPAPIPYPEED